MQFLSYLINGISLGSVYALIALGYTMVYGIAKMLNFAHGDVIMIGSYVVFFAFGSAGMNPCWPLSFRWSSAPFWALRSSASPTARCVRPRLWPS